MATTLFDLPVEIRELIYLECDFDFHVVQSAHGTIKSSRYLNGHKLLPADCCTKYPLLPLLAVNKQIRNEVLSLFPLLARRGRINFDMNILVKGDVFKPSWRSMTLGLPPASKVNVLSLSIVIREDARDGFGPTLSERPVEMITGLARFIVSFLYYGPSFLDAPAQYHMCFMDPFSYLNSAYSETRRGYPPGSHHEIETLLLRVQADGPFNQGAELRMFKEFIRHIRMVAKLDPVIKLVRKIRLEVGYTQSTQPIRVLGEWELTTDSREACKFSQNRQVADSHWKWLQGEGDLVN